MFKSEALFLVFLLLSFSISVTFTNVFLADGSLSSIETNLLSLVNGTQAYSFDLHLESISLSHLAFRAAGSPGADEAADWIAGQLQNYGLQVEKEVFQFKTWDLKSEPVLIIDDDGNPYTTGDQSKIESFHCAHYSLPTPGGGVFSDLVVLPLPEAANIAEIGSRPIDTVTWNAINTAGKVVLVGAEVRQDPSRNWESAFKNKLSVQTPAAVIFTFWNDWLEFVPDFFPSAGGCPFSYFGKYLWNLNIPTGFVDYQTGLWIRNRESSDVSAKVIIDTVVGDGPNYNIVGKLPGHVEPNKLVIVSGHYDTVMCAGFCDNGAGTSGVIELARVFTEAVKTGLYSPKFSILFVAFADEEVGLVGAAEFVRKHKSEMSNVVAVVNLDCIGNDYLNVTETDPSDRFDLDEVILDAAQDLGITATLSSSGGSDHEVFLDPATRNSIHYSLWGVNLGISDATPVKASSMLISYPLSYRDMWNMGSPGWIHTTSDNSTSTQTLGWVEIENLEAQIRVAALTVMRVSPSVSSSSTDLNKDGKVDIQDITLVAVAFGTKPGDQKWNETADLDKNDVVNIIDITMVAKDFGKTV